MVWKSSASEDCWVELSRASASYTLDQCCAAQQSFSCNQQCLALLLLMFAVHRPMQYECFPSCLEISAKHVEPSACAPHAKLMLCGGCSLRALCCFQLACLHSGYQPSQHMDYISSVCKLSYILLNNWLMTASTRASYRQQQARCCHRWQAWCSVHSGDIFC